MGREATPYESKSQLFYAVVWLLTTALLLTAFQTVGIPKALGDDAVDPSDLGASDFQSVDPDLSEQVLPTVLYGGLLWSVADVEVKPTEEFLGRSVIDVSLELTNSLTNTRLRVSEREVSLVTAGGLVLPPGRFVDVGPRLAIDPGRTAPVTFRVLTGHDKNPDPNDLSVVIGESNRIPASIPLTGEKPQHEAPISLAVEATPARMVDPDNAARQIVVEPTAATIGVNVGPYRAAVGERLALVRVKIQRSTSSDTSGFLDLGYWSMAADGLAIAPIIVARAAEVDGNAEEVILLFAFPADASDFDLSAGVGTEAAATFALVLPGRR